MATRNPPWSRDEIIVTLDFYLKHALSRSCGSAAMAPQLIDPGTPRSLPALVVLPPPGGQTLLWSSDISGVCEKEGKTQRVFPRSTIN